MSNVCLLMKLLKALTFLMFLPAAQNLWWSACRVASVLAGDHPCGSRGAWREVYVFGFAPQTAVLTWMKV